MFTGIIESLGVVESVAASGGNLELEIRSSLTPELKIDQSVSHNGVCLTVVGIHGQLYRVTAVAETLSRSNFDSVKKGDLINLERSMLLNGRLDGHLVQGHVDARGTCEEVSDQAGSWVFRFSYPDKYDNLIVEKGSICVNGVSLTVASCGHGWFTVAIIPFTFEHTNFKRIVKGTVVNLEFDILGKYVMKSLASKSTA